MWVRFPHGALRCATGVDYRGEGLTKEQASKMLAEANERSGYSKQHSKKGAAVKAENELIGEFNRRLNEIMDACYEELTKRTLKNVWGVGEEGQAPRYLMVGCCGFARLTYDKRSKKMKAFDEYVKAYFCESVYEDSKFQKEMLRRVPLDVQRRLRESGNPLKAILYQDLDVKLEYYAQCAQIANEMGHKCHVASFID